MSDKLGDAAMRNMDQLLVAERFNQMQAAIESLRQQNTLLVSLISVVVRREPVTVSENGDTEPPQLVVTEEDLRAVHGSTIDVTHKHGEPIVVVWREARRVIVPGA